MPKEDGLLSLSWYPTPREKYHRTVHRTTLNQGPPFSDPPCFCPRCPRGLSQIPDLHIRLEASLILDQPLLAPLPAARSPHGDGRRGLRAAADAPGARSEHEPDEPHAGVCLKYGPGPPRFQEHQSTQPGPGCLYTPMAQNKYSCLRQVLGS